MSDLSQIHLQIDVQNALQRLPLKERMVLWLTEACGYSLRELETVLGWPAHRCRVIRQRAHQLLRRQLWMYGEEQTSAPRPLNREFNY